MPHSSARLHSSLAPTPTLSIIEDFCSQFDPVQARFAPERGMSVNRLPLAVALIPSSDLPCEGHSSSFRKFKQCEHISASFIVRYWLHRTCVASKVPRNAAALITGKGLGRFLFTIRTAHKAHAHCRLRVVYRRGQCTSKTHAMGDF